MLRSWCVLADIFRTVQSSCSLIESKNWCDARWQQYRNGTATYFVLLYCDRSYFYGKTMLNGCKARERKKQLFFKLCCDAGLKRFGHCTKFTHFSQFGSKITACCAPSYPCIFKLFFFSIKVANCWIAWHSMTDWCMLRFFYFSFSEEIHNLCKEFAGLFDSFVMKFWWKKVMYFNRLIVSAAMKLLVPMFQFHWNVSNAYRFDRLTSFL